MISTSIPIQRAILVGLITPQQNEKKLNEYLDELSFLAETAGVKTISRVTQKLEFPDPKTFVGKGKLQTIKEFVDAQNIDLIIFDDELSASQLRNIGKTLNIKILDRNNLILDIFTKRAKTSQAKIQVELAQYQYMLPRLTRMWTHLEKQKGGIGMRGGAGEREIETDRRRIRDKITLLKNKLTEIDNQNTVQRKNRSNFIRVSLVGYTNTGKSTLMNLLCKTDLLAENKLFATVDTTVRKVVIENLPFLLSDTVGFIRKLPHHLIESFKSTLDEVRDSDILIHVVDISHENFQDQITVVNETLHGIGVTDKLTLLVFNKIDLFNHVEKIPFDDGTTSEDINTNLQTLKESWISKTKQPCLFISALKKENINELRTALGQLVKELHFARYPYN